MSLLLRARYLVPELGNELLYNLYKNTRTVLTKFNIISPRSNLTHARARARTHTHTHTHKNVTPNRLKCAGTLNSIH